MRFLRKNAHSIAQRVSHGGVHASALYPEARTCFAEIWTAFGTTGNPAAFEIQGLILSVQGLFSVFMCEVILPVPPLHAGNEAKPASAVHTDLEFFLRRRLQ